MEFKANGVIEKKQPEDHLLQLSSVWDLQEWEVKREQTFQAVAGPGRWEEVFSVVSSVRLSSEEGVKLGFCLWNVPALFSGFFHPFCDPLHLRPLIFLIPDNNRSNSQSMAS